MSRHHRCPPSVVGLMLLALPLASSDAAAARKGEPAAEVYGGDAGRFELHVGAVFPVYRDSERFDELEPVGLMTLGAGYTPAAGVLTALTVRADIADAEADRYEILADVTYTHEIGPWQLLGGVELGYYTKELRGGDFVFDDDGFIATLSLGGGYAPFAGVGLGVEVAWALQHSKHHARNTSSPEWVQALRLGVVASKLF